MEESDQFFDHFVSAIRTHVDSIWSANAPNGPPVRDEECMTTEWVGAPAEQLVLKLHRESHERSIVSGSLSGIHNAVRQLPSKLSKELQSFALAFGKELREWADAGLDLMFPPHPGPKIYKVVPYQEFQVWAVRAASFCETIRTVSQLAVDAESDRFFSVTEAAEAIDVTAPAISKACSNAKIIFTGDTYNRRVDIVSVARWNLERKRKKR